MLAHPETVTLVRAELKLNALTDGAVRALIERTFSLAESSQTVGPEELLARTQEEALRGLVEELIGGEPVRHAGRGRVVPRASAGDRGALVSSGSPPNCTGRRPRPSDPSIEDRNERLRAMREAHRARGTLHVQRDSNGGTG